MESRAHYTLVFSREVLGEAGTGGTSWDISGVL
jgi:hypothetical protein